MGNIMQTNAFCRLFRNTSDSVFGIDGELRVCFWNDACEKLTGLTFQRVRDRKCYDVLSGADIRGDSFCGPDCDVGDRIMRNLPVKDYDMVIDDAEGAKILINVGVYLIPREMRSGEDPAAFLSMRRVDCYRFLQRMEKGGAVAWSTGTPEKFNLTPRELEVLKMASHGMNTANIAEKLFISSLTVKNHFKNIFPKLKVHSRTEAVSLALRMNII
jgi:DNA-binding CsgD family transcriptional regulator